jgi:FlaA1/EpsC-like NDP-sugar epimerase
MGATKLLAERLMTAANHYKGFRKISFSWVRFGNVLDSRGSVIPLFINQIKKGGPVTVTDAEMTRFVMSIPRSVALILKAGTITRSGEIFILKMPALKIGDLAEVMVKKFAPKYGHDPKKIKIKFIGERPGEKIHEELMTEHEARSAYEDKEMFIVLPESIQLTSAITYKLPPNPQLKKFKKAQRRSYSSEDSKLLTKKDISKLLDELSN